MSEKKLRLFWAVNLPAELKTKLVHVQERLKAAGADAKWVEHENLHVTVKFLGDTGVDLVAGIIGTAADCLKGCRPFKLDVDGLGFFPGSASPRVVWAGLKGEVSRLVEIARLIEEAMTVHGFPREGRKFSPHLTLARIKSAKKSEDLVRIIEAEAPGIKNLGIFSVSSVDLMQSHLTSRGPLYTRLAAVKLGN
ncbi:MAG: RNA 2',3'-cyclic phosphodiesterase [Peptococcaceae bacterium]|nr:RNA 2',3'-cyclic phosphodiesterase [Peptococcaceae bacterium]